MDCGGGTTDAGMYKITQERPLRLAQEVKNPEGTTTSIHAYVIM